MSALPPRRWLNWRPHEKVEAGFGKKKDYDKLWETRRGRGPGGFNESRRKRYAAALADRITAMLAEWEAADAKEQAPYEFRLKELTKSLAALDASGSMPLILRVLSIPERVTSWSWKSLEIFETLLFNGVVLPADSTLKWFDAVLERVRLHRYDDQQVGLLLQALCLLPFIDTPAVGIAKVGEVISRPETLRPPVARRHIGPRAKPLQRRDWPPPPDLSGERQRRKTAWG